MIRVSPWSLDGVAKLLHDKHSVTIPRCNKGAGRRMRPPLLSSPFHPNPTLESFCWNGKITHVRNLLMTSVHIFLEIPISLADILSMSDEVFGFIEFMAIDQSSCVACKNGNSTLVVGAILWLLMCVQIKGSNPGPLSQSQDFGIAGKSWDTKTNCGLQISDFLW